MECRCGQESLPETSKMSKTMLRRGTSLTFEIQTKKEALPKGLTDKRNQAECDIGYNLAAIFVFHREMFLLAGTLVRSNNKLMALSFTYTKRL